MRRLVVLLPWLLWACPPLPVQPDAGSDAGGIDAPDAGVDAGGDAGVDAGVFRVTRLRTGVADAGDGTGIAYELLRIEVPGHAPTYAQWMPVGDGGARPVFVTTQPYDGIDWTGEPVDQRWAALGDGLHPDADEPNGGPDAGVIAYALRPPDVQAAMTFLPRLHNVSSLALFGRFYAGGSIQNDVDDMVAGFEFLAREPGVDRDNIAIFGGSWGGFEALYAAAHAPASVTPKVGVALYPLSDFAAEWTFVTSTLPQRYTQPATRARNATFFEPYQRRITATTGGAPDAGGDFTGFTATDLAARLSTRFLVIHDDWDTLVDFAQSERLVALRPDVVQPLWLRHATPPMPWDSVATDHGPAVAALNAGLYSLIMPHLLLPISDTPVVYVPWSQGTFGPLLLWARDQTRAGAPHQELAPLLVELCDPRIAMYDTDSMTLMPGAQFVAAAVNAVWGTQFTSATIAAGLSGGLPP